MWIPGPQKPLGDISSFSTKNSRQDRHQTSPWPLKNIRAEESLTVVGT